LKAVAVVPSKREIKLIQAAPPELASPADVKLRMLEIGICGTDKEICAFQYGTPPAGCDHLIIGHESLGEVVEVGSAVSRIKVGDLAVPMVRRPCSHPECLACRSGRQDFCSTGDFTERGIKMAHGFMTELVVDDQQYMNVVPAVLREVAVLVEPLTIAEKALTEIWRVQQRLPWTNPAANGRTRGKDHRAVVLGAGPVGLLGAMTLLTAGFKTFVYSKEPDGGPKSGLVRSIGAEYLSATGQSIPQLADRVGCIDVVYEATGASQVAFELIERLGINGIFVFTGVPGRKTKIEIESDLIMRNLVLKNQVVLGSVNASRAAFEAAIHDLGIFLRRWPAAVRGLITARVPLEAHREVLLGKLGGVKNVIALT
jgi:glucose 1-dehydrogenase